MKIQTFVFNYSLFGKAFDLYQRFSSIGCDTYLLNCECKNDPPFEATDKILKLPNIYYSGQWNKVLEIADCDVIFIISSDISVPIARKLIRKMTNFYKRHGDKAALYAPDVWWTPWTYDPSTLKDVGNLCKIVPSTDSMVWSLKTDLAHKVGPIDLNINKIGWGIEIVAAWKATIENKYTVRDYSIKLHHPKNSNYDRNKADVEFRTMINHFPKDHINSFWKHYESRNKFAFGWNGKYKTPKAEAKFL